MTRILFVLLFVTTLAMTTLGQNPSQPEVAAKCDLSLAQAPTIRGIRLGMKPDEWLKLFPGSDQEEKIKAALARPPQYPDRSPTAYKFSASVRRPINKKVERHSSHNKLN